MCKKKCTPPPHPLVLKLHQYFQQQKTYISIQIHLLQCDYNTMGKY